MLTAIMVLSTLTLNNLGDIMKKNLLLFFAILLLAGCASAAQHRVDVMDDSKDRLTVGKVQKEISVGMSSAAVVEVLGSPNMVSTDEERREVWVYDKVSTVNAYSTSANAGTLILFGAEGRSGATSTSQKTLTIVIKFDKESKVRDFAYHNSSF